LLLDEKEMPRKWVEKAQKLNYKEPMLIQEKAFQILSQQKNIVGISPTGSGKTLAYLWPLLLKTQPKAGNQLLILTSSQELGMQVTNVATDWAQALNLKVQSLIGGANVNRQIEKLKEKPEILVGTPGRVLELMQKKKLKSHQLKAVVFDEADQLLQDETLPLVSNILKIVPNTVQFGFFSATAGEVLPQIKDLVSENLEVVDVTKEDQSQGVINHYYLKVANRKTVDSLRRLGNLPNFQALVFFNHLSDLGNAEKKLRYHKMAVSSIASDQNKEERRSALQRFKKGAITELLSTDVAARGIDINALPFVINHEVPLTKESYLHRSGRVGRMGAKGYVITLVQENSLGQLKKLAQELAIDLQEVYLYGGQLLLESPEKEKQVIQKRKKTPKKNTSFVEKPKTKSHKKNRKRDQKNKGARRK